MTTPSIRTDDGAIQSGSGQASAALKSARTGGGRANAPGVDPRLAVAVDDTAEQNRRGGDKVDGGIDLTKKDSRGKSEIDAGGSEDINKLGGALLAGLGGAGSGLMGALGRAGGGGQGAQMPQMPQVPAASAGQSLPGVLSGANPSQALASLLSGGAVGGSGSGSLGRGGAGGAGGPSSPGQTEYEQRIIDRANEVVAAGIPYAWGGGTLDGIGQGIRDGGAADAAGDYAKQDSTARGWPAA